MPITRMTSLVRMAAAALGALTLSACASVTLVTPYDDKIDAGLTALSESTQVFVNKMVDAQGTPEGTYARNKDFYLESDAKLDTLIARAEAHRVLGVCPGPAVVMKAVDASKARIDAFKAEHPEMRAADVLALDRGRDALNLVKGDDCEVGLLKLLRQSYDDLETFHKAQGDRGIPASARDSILVGGVGSLIRSAITVEVAKKALADKGDGK